MTTQTPDLDRFREAANRAQPPASTVMFEMIERIEAIQSATDNSVRQAEQQAQEARTQRSSVLEILRVLGLPERDWEAVSLVKKRIAELDGSLQEPVAYEFQHEDTGLIDFVDPQQIEWGFEKSNPRWQKIGPVFRNPPAPAVPDDWLKDYCVRWYRWWHNQPGANTDDGYDDWFDQHGRAMLAAVREGGSE